VKMKRFFARLVCSIHIARPARLLYLQQCAIPRRMNAYVPALNCAARFALWPDTFAPTGHGAKSSPSMLRSQRPLEREGTAGKLRHSQVVQTKVASMLRQ
jgi:hypothetical protein